MNPMKGSTDIHSLLLLQWKPYLEFAKSCGQTDLAQSI
jgi:hypothetical protein